MRILRLITALLLLAWLPAAAQSPCTDLPLPWAEDFDTYTTGHAPTCWTVNRNYDLGPSPRVDGSRAHSGAASLMLYSGSLSGSHYSMAIAPPLDVADLDGVFLRLHFYAASTATRLEVGVCQDTGRYTHLFQPVDTLHADRPGVWQEMVVDLGRYAGTGRRLAFRMQRALQGATAECYVDDLRIGTCGTTQPTATHLTARSVTLDWERYGDGPVGVTYSGITIADATPPLTIVGLDPSTTYTFSVGCAGSASQQVSATTLAPAALVPAYYNPFGNSFLTLQPSDTLLHILPLQESVATGLLNVALQLRGGAGATLEVGVIEYPLEPQSFVPVDTLVATAAWQRHLVSLAPYTGTSGYIAFRTSGATLYVDDLRIARCMVDSVRFYGLTESSVILDWEPLTAGNVTLEYGPLGFTPGTGTTVAATSKPFTLSGLTPATQYDLYVYPDCGDLPCAYDLHRVTTFAHTTTVPYCTPFDASGLPQGWVCPQGTATASTSALEGSHCLSLAAGTLAAMPSANDIDDSLLLDFYAAGASTLVVGTMDHPFGTFTPQHTLNASDWQRRLLRIGIPAGHVVAFQAVGDWRLDALALHRDALLSASASDIGQTSARISWTALGSDSVRLEYKAVASASANFADGTGTALLAATDTLLSGLAPATHYAIHLIPLADTIGALCQRTVLHILTAPPPASVPICEDFNSLSANGFPASWRRSSTLGNYPLASAQRNHSAPKSLYFRAAANKHTVALLPELTSSSQHLVLAFWYNASAMPVNSRFMVGYLDDISTPDAFVPVDTITVGTLNTWHHYRIDLGVPTSRIAIKLVGGRTEARVFIDDLCIEPCAAYDFSVTNIDSTAVRISWQSVGVATVEATLNGEGLVQTFTYTSSPAEIHGLNPFAAYTLTLRALCDCGDYGAVHHASLGSTGNVATDNVTTYSIHTLPGYATPPYCNGFESSLTGHMPYHWRRISGTASVSDAKALTGYRSFMMRNNTTVTTAPFHNLASLTGSVNLYTNSAASLVVGVMTVPDSANSFLAIDTLTLSHPRQWQRFFFNLAAATPAHEYIAFRLANTDTCTLYLDDLAVSTCGIANASISDGIVQWQAVNSPSAIDIEYGPTGFTPGTGTTSTVAAPPFSLGALPAGVNYDIYLSAQCDSIGTCSPLKLSLNSPSEPPYCEFFEVVTPSALPDGWTIGRAYNGAPTTALHPTRVLVMKGRSVETNRSMAIFPIMTTQTDSMQLAFSMRSANSGIARIALGYVDANADPNTFTPFDTLQNSANNRWERRLRRLLPPDGKRLAFSCYSASQNVEVWIDSLALTHYVTPAVSATSAHTASIAIEAAGGMLEYGLSGFTPGSGTTLTLTSRQTTLAGLTANRQYWFYTLDEHGNHTCLPPVKVTMPTEAALPYCRTNVVVSQLQLPEMAAPSIADLHLYLTLRPGTLVVGVMGINGDWNSFEPLDTIVVAPGTRSQRHLNYPAYSGNGHFIAFRSIGGNVTIERLHITDCPLIEATLRNNEVLLTGNGTAEYGPAGFAFGSGTLVSVADSLRITSLSDNTVYDFRPLCSATPAPCYPPMQWRTSTTVDLPYCCDLASGLPLGWDTSSNTLTPAISLTGGSLALTVATDQQATATLPIFDADSIVLDLEVFFTSTSVALLVGSDTLRVPAGSWQTVRRKVASRLRPQLTAVGNGTIRLRRVEAATCALPRDVSVTLPGGGNVILDWDASGCDNFYFEYRLPGETQGTTVQATTPPMTLALLPDTSYSLYTICAPLATTCRQPLAISTLPPPQSLPYCVDAVETAALPQGWKLLTANGATYLVLPQFDVDSLRRLNILLFARTQNSNQRLTLGTLLFASAPSTFDSLDAIPTSTSSPARYFHVLDSYYGSGRFLALRIEGNGWVDIRDLSVSTCAAYDIRLMATEADWATFSWNQQGSPSVSIEYGPTGFAYGSGTTVAATASPFTISGLDPLTDYTFYASYQCPSVTCRPLVVDTFFIFTPKGGVGCIDYTDLRASYVTCKYGSYENPSQHMGVIDHGYLSVASRHTVHFDTTERDARTGGLLRTVPVGESASVRLGNWGTGGSGTPQAESITYGMTVDSSLFDLLILKYAAVLQDPEHSASLQPRFRLEILNQQDQLIDSCGMAFFIANSNLHWNQAPNEVLWKDWTTVGMDLSAYAGQTIFIRLTTNDCGEGSHFGYAYFTLECASKRMQTEGCSNVPNNRFTVPSGFNYRWYTNLDTTTISDSSSIWVRSDNSLTYYCNLSFVDKPDCNFTMSAFAGARYPLALFDTAVAVANCEFDLALTDRSTISGDGISPIGTGESCESTRWLLPDGSTSTASSLTHHLPDTGFYSVALVAGIASDQCLDTLRRNIHITYPYPKTQLAGRDRRCDNEPPDTIRVRNATSYTWLNGNSSPLIIAPAADTSVTCTTVDSNGCPNTLHHTLRVFPSYRIDDTDSICNSQQTYTWHDTTITVDQTAGILRRNRMLVTAEGCDSLHVLGLQLMPTYYIHHHDTLCHDSRLPFFDTVLTTTGSYLHTDSTSFGCDSLVTMHLQIIPRVYADDILETCDSLVWIDGNTYHYDTIGPLDTLYTTRGCDSVATLHLTVYRSTLEVAIDTFCQGTTYTFRSHALTETGYYADTLSTIHRCDSILAIDLTCLTIPKLTIDSDYDCDSLYHHVVATSDVPYILWSAFPPDPTLDLQEQSLNIDVHPQTRTVYTLYADYAADPHCPATATVTLSPARRPKAQIKVNPDALTHPQVDFDAFDISNENVERYWYINGILQPEGSRHLHASADPDSDTTRVMLVISDGHCSDTALHLLPTLYSTLLAPNVFTPDEDINNAFFFTGHGILTAEIHIYNRFGALVFQSSDFNARWDGRNRKGEPCPTGSYVWTIRYTSQALPTSFKTATGSVLLLR